jgi:DNA polymerase-3 subunit gamma/tau
VFENIIAQVVIDQLKTDILSRRLAPSMLFFGPEASGKGSTAMELARVLSCENDNVPSMEGAAWNCTCIACTRHRALLHPDLAMIGPRAFAAEIAASRAAFLRDPASLPGRLLFIRSMRKLMARFAPSVWEYESKSGKISPLPLLQSLEEEINDFEMLTADQSIDKHDTLVKHIDSLVKNAFKLEDDCMSETIPIAQVRKAAYWSRLKKKKKRKTLIIENADRMKDEARNSLLKLLEEPPESISIILTARRRESMLPTILSRLRPYRFLARSAAEEREIIRRIFRDPGTSPSTKVVLSVNDDSKNGASGLVASYLDSFTPQPSEKLLPLAAFFVAAVVRSAAILNKSSGTPIVISTILNTLGSYCAPIAEAAGLERVVNVKETITALVSRSGNFEGRSFSRFLALALDLVASSLGSCVPAPSLVICSEIWKKRLGEAQAAYNVWNQRPELALESLFYRLKEDMRLM